LALPSLTFFRNAQSRGNCFGGLSILLICQKSCLQISLVVHRQKPHPFCKKGDFKRAGNGVRNFSWDCNLVKSENLTFLWLEDRSSII
jgi:hypothetical protein